MGTPPKDTGYIIFTWYDILAGAMLVCWSILGHMGWEIKVLAWVWFLERDRFGE